MHLTLKNGIIVLYTQLCIYPLSYCIHLIKFSKHLFTCFALYQENPQVKENMVPSLKTYLKDGTTNHVHRNKKYI